MGVGYQFGLIIDEVVGWGMEYQMGVVVVGWFYFQKIGFLFLKFLNYCVGEFFIDVDDDFFDWFLLVVLFVKLINDMWMVDVEFKVFMVYVFDQDCQQQFVVVGDDEGVWFVGVFYFQGDIVFCFFYQVFVDDVGLDFGIFGVGEWIVVDVEGYGEGWWIDWLGLDWLIDIWCVQCVGDGCFGKVCDGDDVVGFVLFDWLVFQVVEGEDF